MLAGAIGCLRVAEIVWSRRHERALASHGGRTVREKIFPAMAILHASVLIATPLEAAAWRRSSRPGRLGRVGRVARIGRAIASSRAVRGAALAALAGATALRAWKLASLGRAWSIRVLAFPDGARPVVTRGPYRFIRHPNYAAVIVELLALPLAAGAPVTALVGTALDAWILRARIRTEERELMRDTRYRTEMSAKPRFFPGLGPGLGPWLGPRT
jgi:methyltransferase